jgi:uncharacterized Ntn-hydrolase superfamily protein
LTFSIVARDPATGDFGIAVASKFLAVGAVVPWARAGVGAVATQAWANVTYGPDGLALLESGREPVEVVELLTARDPGRAERQFGLVDAAGRAATYTGEACIPWAGGRLGAGVAAQGNLLAGAGVVDALVETFEATGGGFADRLLAALLAGDRAGGDRRGRQSAALLVVRVGGGYGGANDRWLDLRVDDHPDPVPELIRIRGIARLLNERPDPADLMPIDADLAAELRARLAAAGWSPDRDDAFVDRIRASSAGAGRVGTPRTPPDGWGPDWDAALAAWMSFANLEERMAAVGWIDPEVVAGLRAATGG